MEVLREQFSAASLLSALSTSFNGVLGLSSFISGSLLSCIPITFAVGSAYVCYNTYWIANNMGCVEEDTVPFTTLDTRKLRKKIGENTICADWLVDPIVRAIVIKDN